MRLRKSWWDEILRPVRRAASVRTRGFAKLAAAATGRGDPAVRLPKIHPSLLTGAQLPITLRFHALRHSAASLLLAQGVHPRAIMELLGYSSITVTMNVYGHVLPAMMREAAEKMERILSL
jgi:integrase